MYHINQFFIDQYVIINGNGIINIALFLCETAGLKDINNNKYAGILFLFSII